MGLFRPPIKEEDRLTLDICHSSGTIQRQKFSRSQFRLAPVLFASLSQTTWGGLFPAFGGSDEFFGEVSVRSSNLSRATPRGVIDSIKSKKSEFLKEDVKQRQEKRQSNEDKRKSAEDVDGEPGISRKVVHPKSSIHKPGRDRNSRK